MTFHRMDTGLDTGAILAQEAIPLDDEHSWEELQPKFVEAVGRLLPVALERVAAGDPGDPQDESRATYQSFLEPEYVEIDWSPPAEEIARQVRAWRFGGRARRRAGRADRARRRAVRVLRVSLEPAEGREVECGDGSVWIVESEPV